MPLAATTDPQTPNLWVALGIFVFVAAFCALGIYEIRLSGKAAKDPRDTDRKTDLSACGSAEAAEHNRSGGPAKWPLQP